MEYFAFGLVLLAAAFGAFRIIKLQRFDAVGGLVLGYAYFVGGPTLQILFNGGIFDTQMGFAPVQIGLALELAGYLLLGGIATLLLLNFPTTYAARTIGGPFDAERFARTYFIFHLASYFALAVVIFFMSGKQSGGHWMENNDRMYAQGALPSLVGNFYNVLRVTFSGVVIFAFTKRLIKFRTSIAILMVFAIFEVFISSNRIVILFALIAAVWIAWTYKRRYIFALAVLVPFVLQFNVIFPIARGLMWSEGLSVAQFSDSIQTASRFKEANEDASGNLFDAAFESSNLMGIQYVMDTYGRSAPYLYGETMFIKPFAFFLPRAVFEYKPEGFNTRIGRAVTGNPILALNTTLLGEAFGNFGWFGPLFYVIFLTGFLFFSRFAGGELYKYQMFFVAFAAWRFEFSFFVIATVVTASCFIILRALISFRIFNRRLRDAPR